MAMFDITDQAKPPDGATSVIEKDLEIQGDVNTSGSLIIRGKVTGNVIADTVSVHTGADIQGDVEGNRVQVQGSVAGQLRAKTLTIQSTATVLGDLAYSTLVLEGGADYEGLCRRLKKDESPLTRPLFHPSPRLIKSKRSPSPPPIPPVGTNDAD